MAFARTEAFTMTDATSPALLSIANLHKGYGHHFMQYNHRALQPLGEARSNWDVMKALAAAMGYGEP